MTTNTWVFKKQFLGFQEITVRIDYKVIVSAIGCLIIMNWILFLKKLLTTFRIALRRKEIFDAKSKRLFVDAFVFNIFSSKCNQVFDMQPILHQYKHDVFFAGFCIAFLKWIAL